MSAILTVPYVSVPPSNVGDYGWQLALAVSPSLAVTVAPPSGGVSTAPIYLTCTPPNGGADFYLPFTAGNAIWASPGGLYAAGFWVYRNILATDFPLAGTYNCQLVATLSASEQLSSSPFTVTIGARI